MRKLAWGAVIVATTAALVALCMKSCSEQRAAVIDCTDAVQNITWPGCPGYIALHSND